MGFLYTREHLLSQHLLTATLLGGAVAVGSTVAFAEAWAGLLEAVPARVLLGPGLLLLHTLWFWPVCFAFHAVDTTGKPDFIAKHRIQKERRKHPDLGPTLWVLVRNQFILLPPLLFLLGEALLWRGWVPEVALPSFGRLAFELIAQAIVAILVFYTAHRFLHRKWWMKRVHRVHHEFKTTTAFASEYAHPFEFVVGNFATLATGALIFQPHLLSMYVFSLLALSTILVHHSGYALPWAPWAVPHDWHHYRVKELFGTIGLLDRLLGTDEEFRDLKDGDTR